MNRSPLLVSRGFIIFPSQVIELDIGRIKSVNAIKKVESSKADNQTILIVSQKDPESENPTQSEIYTIGTLCTILSSKSLNDGTIVLTVRGEHRAKINKISNAHLGLDKDEKSIYLEAEYDVIKEKQSAGSANLMYAKKLYEKIQKSYLNKANLKKGDTEMLEAFKKVLANPSKFADIVCAYLSKLGVKIKILQSLLEEINIGKRLKSLNEHLTKLLDASADKELEKQTIDSLLPKEQKVKEKSKNANDKENFFDKDEEDRKINKKINDNLSKQQKEYYLRERLKAIKEELGEISSKDDDVAKIREKVNSQPYPANIKEKILSELNKYETSASSQESSMIRSYIDWLVELPWWQESKDNTEIRKVKSVLEKNHYGLTKVKERIIEYLAVKIRNGAMRGPILCLVGPPGVGKSSLAKSIAEALNKSFVKMSLGGLHDEAEIRGHRKTYVGAMPGRIVKCMRKVKVVNPLFLLDEIDKLSYGNQGDPASALLEVLDPEQNSQFYDNYLEEDYDLSKVMFVATANYAENISEALYDRLEIIELSSYTDNEKLAIANQYLIPRALEEAKVSKTELEFKNEAIEYIMRHFTREAGVRELERTIQTIVRKFIVQQQTGKVKNLTVDVAVVKKYLKKEIYDYTLKDEVPVPGVVNGMAYTSSGGDLLPIEVTYSKGKGDLVVTGNLKETMRESASVALGYVKANASKFNINPDMFKEIDIQIHVPSGGIPKDGPSAGVALTTAIISSLTSRSVDSKIAMTGEITLRGKVLVIGGVKEKTISAYRGGVRTILMPEKDSRYLDEVPKEILKNLKIIFVKNYSDVYKNIFK